MTPRTAVDGVACAHAGADKAKTKAAAISGGCMAVSRALVRAPSFAPNSGGFWGGAADRRGRGEPCPAAPPVASVRHDRQPPDPAKPAPRISFVSLGCPKALVDSERILTRLRAEGYELSKSHAGADAVIVNTCGFLDSAKKESLDAIGAAMAENGKVIVTGCMGAEPDAIRDAFPNVARSPARRPTRA